MQSLLQYNFFSPIKKIGRKLAPIWPWPVPARVRSKTLYIDLRSAVGRGIYVTGKFDDQVFEALSLSIKPGTVFIDVGANIGYYSLLAMDFVGTNGMVHAFEIDPRPLVCLSILGGTNQERPWVQDAPANEIRRNCGRNLSSFVDKQPPPSRPRQSHE